MCQHPQPSRPWQLLPTTTALCLATVGNLTVVSYWEAVVQYWIKIINPTGFNLVQVINHFGIRWGSDLWGISWESGLSKSREKLPSIELRPTALAWSMTLSLTLHPLRAMVMTYSHAKVHLQRSVASEDRVETDGCSCIISLANAVGKEAEIVKLDVIQSNQTEQIFFCSLLLIVAQVSTDPSTIADKLGKQVLHGTLPNAGQAGTLLQLCT